MLFSKMDGFGSNERKSAYIVFIHVSLFSIIFSVLRLEIYPNQQDY